VPREASDTAIARPNPRLAPVTIAARPSSRPVTGPTLHLG
jgi:hypothetical protein